MKNENEYRENDRLYIRAIRKCICKEKSNGKYLLTCKIHERGEHEYVYTEGEPCLKRDRKMFWLADEAGVFGKSALETAREAAALFDEKASEVRKEAEKVRIIENVYDLYYRRSPRGTFDLLLEFTGEDGESSVLFCGLSAEEMIREATWQAFLKSLNEDPTVRILDQSTEETIHQNPLYRKAQETGDDLLMRQMKLYYRIATEKECSWLGKVLGKRILPGLPEEYDRNYVVDSDTVDCRLLDDSGYTILHRPYFAMMGSTHEKWQLNPHTKGGVDAAKTDEKSISFNDYLALFEEK